MLPMQFQIFWGIPEALLKHWKAISTYIEILTLKTSLPNEN